MTRGAVQTKIVMERLQLARECLGELRQIPAATLAEFESDFRNASAAESLLRRAIEALVDVARHLLSRAYGEGKLEYGEVARRAIDRDLVKSPEGRATFPKIARYRNRLAHHYLDVKRTELFEILRDRLGDLASLADDLDQAARRLVLAEPQD